MPRAKRSRTSSPPPVSERAVEAALAARLSVIGRKGGRATKAALTPEERSESASQAARARWRKTTRRGKGQG